MGTFGFEESVSRVQGQRRQGRRQGRDQLGRQPGRYAHRRSAAVIADRHVFVIGQQRIVGAEQFADVCGVMNADIEIGVIADAERQMQCAFMGRAQEWQDPQPHAVTRQQGKQRMAQRAPVAGGQGKQRIERGLRQRRAHRHGQVVCQPGQIEHMITDRGSNAGRAIVSRIDPQRQVLHRKVSVCIGPLDPTARFGCVGVVDHGLGSSCSQAAWRGARLVWLHSASMRGASVRNSACWSGVPMLQASSSRWPLGSKK